MLDLLLSAKPAATALVLGVAVTGGSVALAYLRHRATTLGARHLLELALKGQAHQARVQARSGSAALRPILEALASPPTSQRAFPQELLLAIPAGAPPLALPFYALGAVRDAGPASMPTAGALLLTMLVLVLASILGVALVTELSRRTGRVVRGVCIELMARQARTSAERELAERRILRREGEAP